MAESESGGAPLMTSTHSVQSAAAATPQASPRAPGPALKGPGCPASVTAGPHTEERVLALSRTGTVETRKMKSYEADKGHAASCSRTPSWCIP